MCECAHTCVSACECVRVCVSACVYVCRIVLCAHVYVCGGQRLTLVSFLRFCTPYLSIYLFETRSLLVALSLLADLGRLTSQGAPGILLPLPPQPGITNSEPLGIDHRSLGLCSRHLAG